MDHRRFVGALVAVSLGFGWSGEASSRPTVWERAWRPTAILEERTREEVERVLFEAELFGWRSPSTPDRLRSALDGLRLVDAERAVDVRLRFLLGRVLGLLGEWPRAASVLEAAIEEAPTHPMAGDAFFRLAIAYAWLGEREREIEMYDAFLERTHVESARATALSNRAEARMAQGDLEGAVRDYRAALAITADPVATLGLAVALDRLGDVAAALFEAEKSHLLDPEARRLGSDGVFFVPPYERHWYEALLAMASASRAERPAEAASHWRAAAASFGAYVAEAGPEDPWLPLAEARRLQCESRARRGKTFRAR